MSKLHQISVSLTQGQKEKLARAYRNKEGVSIRLKHSALSGSDLLMVPMNTVKKLAKHKNAGVGVQITISKNNIRKQTGKGIFSALLPALRAVAPTVAKTLGLSALAGAASEGASQIIKKISGGQIFRVPNDKLFMLAQMSNLLTPKQKRDLAAAYSLPSDLNFRVTQKQVGNGVGTILASIGIPLVIDAVKKLTGGSAVRMGSKGRGSPRIGRPPPFIGNWEGRGKKKKKKKKRPERPGSLTRQKQSIQKHSSRRSNSLKKPKFHGDIPMSNFDLLEWCKYLKIPINNVLSRDTKAPHNHKLAIFIYNLEPSYMSGSHWIATYVEDNVINYFDSFGLPPFQEKVNHAKKKNLTLMHQNQQIQNLYTSTCGYFCLYFLNEMHKGTDYFDLLQVFDFDTDKNEKFIEKYFTNIHCINH